jgi:hypothetical protein
MLIYYALGRLGVQRTRDASQSALPNAPVVPDRPLGAFRVGTAAALHQLAHRIGPIDAQACGGTLRQA